jgi:hypothetical protein
MKLAATILARDIERAVATGTRDAGRGLRNELRQQVASAGLGRRLSQQLGRQALPEPPFRVTADGLNCRAAALSAASPSPSTAPRAAWKRVPPDRPARPGVG